jgi:hypothetical protein
MMSVNFYYEERISGNFIAVIQFLSIYDLVLKELLDKEESRPDKITLSPMFQKKCMNILAEKTK